MKVVSGVGARPQFIKAAVLSRELRQLHEEILVHTGQHYDANMSDVFFAELDIPIPDYHLGVGSGGHGAQTGAMLAEIEKVLLKEKPDLVVVYGDTNSTLAGALAASKLHIRVAHIEAGLRSHNRDMPEEINRVITDHISDLLFCPSLVAVNNLAREGIQKGVHIVGDLMQDALIWALNHKTDASSILRRFRIEDKNYLLVTLHRAENTDNKERLFSFLTGLNNISERIIFPVHPRTKKRLSELGWQAGRHIMLIEPLGYMDMALLERSARLIITDSGGIQKEAYWLGVGCVTLRDETEWVETVQNGWNTLVGSDMDKMMSCVRNFLPPASHPPLYGEKGAGLRIVQILV